MYMPDIYICQGKTCPVNRMGFAWPFDVLRAVSTVERLNPSYGSQEISGHSNPRYWKSPQPPLRGVCSTSRRPLQRGGEPCLVSPASPI